MTSYPPSATTRVPRRGGPESPEGSRVRSARTLNALPRRGDPARGARGRAAARLPGTLFDGKSQIRARVPPVVAAEVSFLTLPHPSPSTDAAFHRESHQGGDARAGRGSPPRPQLRRHRAGTRTRPPAPPFAQPVAMTSDGFVFRSSKPCGWSYPPVARRFVTRADHSAHAPRTDHARPHRRRHRHRRQGAQVHGYVSSPRPRTVPPSPTFRETRPLSWCLIHCRGV